MPSGINLAAVSLPGQRVNLIQACFRPPPPPAARSPLRLYAPGRGRRSWRFEYGSLSAISAPHWSSRPSDFVGPDAVHFHPDWLLYPCFVAARSQCTPPPFKLYDAPSTGFSSAGFLFPRTHPLFGSPARCTHCALCLALHLLRRLAPSHPSALLTLCLLRPLHPRPVPRFTPYLRCTRCASAASLPTLQCVRALHHAPRFDCAPASTPCPGASPRPCTSLLASLCPTLTLVPTLCPHPTPTLRTARLASPKRPRPHPLLLPCKPRHLALNASPSMPTPCFASRLPRFAHMLRLASPQQTRSRPQAPRPSHFALHAHALLYLTLAELRPHAAPRFAPANALPLLTCTLRLASPQCPRFALAHASLPPASRFARTPRFAPAPHLSSRPRFASVHALWLHPVLRLAPAHAHRFTPHPAPLPSARVLPQRPRVAQHPRPLLAYSRARASPPRLASPQRTHPRSPAPLPAPSHPAPCPSAHVLPQRPSSYTQYNALSCGVSPQT
ncbi:hypothetical protein DFH08DRAFT_974900 [Mycena albidolilacea]|uniref:Uncharacterized protein n=1 Tax=Mycena albidolilacea TaxID=1033008 RepID=A0AAD7EBU2_9AGAR|nr:hypothetical protein DFH08DRAFT_974900 [Mycena albidolilacea]